MPRKHAGSADEEWLLAAWEAARELSVTTGCVVQISLTPDKRKGVWRVNGRLLESVDGRPVAIRVQNRREYPSVASGGLSASLYGLLIDLDSAHDAPLLVRPSDEA